MYANTENIIPYAQNIYLISGETSKTSETLVSSVKVEKDSLIEIEKYYRIYYDDKWYLGRVISYDSLEICKIIFLQETHNEFLNDQLVMTFKLLIKSKFCMIQYN